MTPALELTNISVTYPARRRQPAIEALRDVSLTIEPKQSVAMLGPNGSGKSTLMRVICGLLHGRNGPPRVRVHGHHEPDAVRRAIGVVFQHPALDPHQTVGEALRDQARLYGLRANDAAERIESDLKDAGLTDRRDQLIKTLSLGLVRRVDLVRALLNRPRLLLLDEPTVGLDPTARERFLRTIEDRRADSSLTVLLSTHLIDEADRQDRVILLHEGRLVADDSPQALQQQLGTLLVTVHDATWEPPPDQRTEWRRHDNAWRRPVGDDRGEAAALAETLARSGVSFTIAPPTLGHVFERLTGRSLDDAPKAESEAA